MDEQEKTFDHHKASIADKILVLAELEHVRRHALRSAVSLYNEDAPDNVEWLHYATIATQAQALRREYQQKHFGDLSEHDWCLCKSAACLRQLAYETQEHDYGMLKMMDDLVDSIWGEALGLDLSDCYACREDKGEIK